MLRAHQRQLLDIVRKIRTGEGHWSRIIAHVTPGGGKSALPVIAAGELIPTIAQKICWVVPRVALQQQAEEAFIDPNFRSMLKHKNLVRVATNEPNPSRGVEGYATTYAALAVDTKKYNAQEFERRKYILVLDEPHHIAEDSSCQAAVKPLIEKAVLTIFMSGTLERGRKEKIAFLPYFAQGGELEISLRDSRETKIITYSRADALAEKSIIPIRVTFMDAKAEWKDRKGNRKFVSSLRDHKKIAKEALWTAVSTQYANELIDSTVDDWWATRKKNPRSKLLIVAATQKLARAYADYIQARHGRPAGIATMDEGAGAMKAINKFKKVNGEKFDILCTVAMAYEGLDVKPVTHIACLTRIRSKPWIEQMMARATRFDPDAGSWESQEAHIFAPDDIFMHRIVDAVVNDQAQLIKPKRVFEGEGGGGGGLRDLFGDLIPIGSGTASKRSKRLEIQPSKLEIPEAEVLTPSQREAKLREEIEYQVNEYALNRRMPVRVVNARLLRRFSKSRTEMNVAELYEVSKWVFKHLRSS
jgi:superfamily II DNA or RNA helicase